MLEYWHKKASDIVRSEHSFILVGIGVEQMRGFAHYGGHICGAIAILPANSAEPAEVEPFPVLVLRGMAIDIFDHAVREYALVLQRCPATVEDFLETCDPLSRATIVSYLPLPVDIFGTRPVWAQDAALSRKLEHKAQLAEVLAGTVATPAGVLLPWPISSDTWRELQTRFASECLVVQTQGISGGGNGTWVCNTYDQARQWLADCAGQSLRVMPFIAGDACNITGLIDASGNTLLLPPSRQITIVDNCGHPGYSGNIFETEFSDGEIQSIRNEVYAIGRRLWELGFHGPFGLDFIRTNSGQRFYHDINPRMNGAVESLDRYLMIENLSPLIVLLLVRSEWSQSDIERLESTLEEAVNTTPTWRFTISSDLAGPLKVTTPPLPGQWHIDPYKLQLTHQTQEAEMDDIREYNAVLLPKLMAGSVFEKGEPLSVGDLYCSPALGQALLDHHGHQLRERLVKAFIEG